MEIKTEQTTILLIEDDDLVADIIINSAYPNSYNFIRSETMSDAILFLMTSGILPSIIICDLSLPDSDSKNTRIAIRDLLSKHASVCVLTNETDINLAIDCFMMGANGFLVKVDIAQPSNYFPFAVKIDREIQYCLALKKAREIELSSYANQLEEYEKNKKHMEEIINKLSIQLEEKSKDKIETGYKANGKT